MTNHANPLRRYLFRRDFVRKVRGLIAVQQRKLTKSSDLDIARLLSQDVKVIFDVGANVGDTVQKYAQRFTDASIYCFEPDPLTFTRLKKRFEPLAHVHPYQMAVAAEEGTAELYVGQYSVMNSLLKPTAAWGFAEQPQTVHVPLTTLDQFALEHAVKQIDVLKMDIQGGEIAALNGAHDLLSSSSIKVIHIECLNIPLYADQPMFFEIAALLHQYGYVFFNFYRVRETHKGQVRWFDGLFVCQELSDKS